MELSGWVFIALTLIVLGYVVPHLTRTRAVVAESRVSDRFSKNLRLVEPVAATVIAERRAENRVPVLKPEIAKRRTEALAMIRPTAPEASRVNARELAAARASRAAAISRRAASGRRRLLLAGTLVAFTVLLWVMVSAGTLAWGWAIPVTLLTGGVAYLGVRAAMVDRAEDAKARAEMARFDQRLRLFRTEEAHAAPVVGGAPSFDQIITPYRGTHRSEPDVDEAAPPKHARDVEPSVFVELGEEQVSRTAPRAADAPLPVEGGPEWTPVPVPVPTYTLKAEVPRREPMPFEAEEGPTAAVPERPSQAAPSYPGVAEDPDAQTFDLEDILARRRVAGA
nr:hypothetical protein [Actinomycetales bacterium]